MFTTKKLTSIWLPKDSPGTSINILPVGTAGVSVPLSVPRCAPSNASKRIVRTEYRQSKSLDLAQRTALIDQLYVIYCETVVGDSRDEFQALVFGAGEVRVALFYGTRDELAGYSYATVQRIEHAGRACAVFCGGVFFRLGYHGGASAVLFGIRHTLRFKLRNPHIPMAYLTRSTTPAVYRRLASTFPRLYPKPGCQTPTYVEALVRELSVRRHYVPLVGNPWVVREDTSLREPELLRHLEGNPYVQFYTELNPRFAEGDSVLTWIPLNVANVAAGIFRTLRPRLAQ